MKKRTRQNPPHLQRAVKTDAQNALSLLWPMTSCVLFAIFGLISLPVSGVAEIWPRLEWCAFFFWAIQRPSALPLSVLFCFGLVYDLYSGQPVGLNAVLWVGLVAGITRQKNFFYGKNFMLEWWGFTMTILIMVLVKTAGFQLFEGHTPPVYQIALGFFVTVLIYPIIAKLLFKISNLEKAHP